MKAVKMLFNGRCSVYRHNYIINDSGIRKCVTEKVYENIMCRISYKNDGCAKESETETTAEQKVKIFMPIDYFIKSGDIIEVEQNGRREKYKACGRARFYSAHQEAELDIFEESV